MALETINNLFYATEKMNNYVKKCYLSSKLIYEWKTHSTLDFQVAVFNH